MHGLKNNLLSLTKELNVNSKEVMIISKKRLDVNFARNDIKSSCPVFCSIQDVIKNNRIKKANKKYMHKMIKIKTE